MRVFVTGATGFIGSAIVRELTGAGHRVLGLARSEAAAATLRAAGAEAHRGELADADGLRRGAAACDGVIHTAFVHDFANFPAACETDRCAIEALAGALAGSSRPLLVSAGVALLAPGRVTVEDDAPPTGPALPRVSEQTALAAAARGVRAAVVRLPPSVHGEGDHGFVPTLIDFARAKGASAYIGAGENRWPAVHVRDAARLYRLALEADFEAGAHFHGVAEEGVPFRALAELIGRRLGVPVVSKAPTEAAEHFGWFALFAAIDSPTSSRRTRERLGWEPAQPGLLADVDQPHYFAAAGPRGLAGPAGRAPDASP